MNPPLRRVFSSQLLNSYSKMIWASPCVEKLMPRVFESRQQLARYTHLTKFSPDLKSYNEGLSKPIWAMLDRAGKTWRGTICLLTAKAFGASFASVMPLAVSCEMLHNASLIIDDIEDHSEVRRGLPAVHILYGPELAVNAGCYLYFIAQMAVNEAQVTTQTRQMLPGIYMQELVALHLGQCSDIYWNQTKGFMPSYEQYYQMIASKTAAMVRLAVKLGAAGAGVEERKIERLTEFADALGIAFQIKDDLLNLQSIEYAKNRKYIGEDITEGKKTLITIRAASESPKAARLLDILAMKTSDLALVNEALAIIRETDALQYAEKEADSFLKQALDVMDEVYPAEEATAHLKSITQFLVSRVG